MKQKLIQSVNNIKNTSPLLLVGEAYYLFRKNYKGKVLTINSQNIREIVAYYSTVELDYILVLEDISNLSSLECNYLLKLVEDSKYPIILLASYDNINNILLSRIKTFIKFSNQITSEFLPPNKGLEVIEDKLSSDSAFIDRVRYEAKYSPRLYYLEQLIGNSRNKSKYLDILS